MFGPFWDRVVAEDARLAGVPADATISEKTLAHRVTAVEVDVNAATAPPDPAPPHAPPAASAISAVKVLPALGVAADAEALGDLELLDVLGEGGMGVVRRARQRSLDRDVAVKTLRPEHASRDKVEALLAEARLTGVLEHPNVIPVHALGRDAEGRVALVMKRVEGETWQTLLERADHPFWTASTRWSSDPLTRNLRLLLEVTDAVHFAHSRGILHRDLKPANVMVGAYGEVYLMDWGIAVRAAAETHQPGGTPAYMAPEMLDGVATVRTDVYLLGAVLHEVLTGKRLHSGRSRMDVLLSVARASEVTYDPSVPRELADICRRALRAEPADRFADAAAFRKAIADHLEHRGSILLAQAAAERGAELEKELLAAAPDPAKITHAAAECRFGFAQALKVWPGNEPARAGLRKSLWALARYEAERGSPAAATALVEELRALEPDPAELAALERRVAERRDERDRLLRRGAELDPTVSMEERRRLVRSLAPFVTAFILLIGVSIGTGQFTPSHAFFIGVPTGGLFLLVLILWLARRSLAKNEFNRRVTGAVVCAMGGLLLHRAVSAILGIPILKIVTNDLAFGSMAAAMAATAFGVRWLFVVAAILALGAVGGALHPERNIAIFCACAALSGVTIVAGVRRGARRGSL